MVQCAYSSGPPDLVIAGLTVVDPMVGVALGLLVLDEAGEGLTGWLAAGMGLAGVVAIVGVVLLSRFHPEVIQRRAAARARSRTQDGGTGQQAASSRKVARPDR